MASLFGVKEEEEMMQGSRALVQGDRFRLAASLSSASQSTSTGSLESLHSRQSLVEAQAPAEQAPRLPSDVGAQSMNQASFADVNWAAINDKLLVNRGLERLVVGISSGVLFDMREDHELLKRGGLEAYHRYQMENENKLLEPGEAFQLVQKLLALNERLDDQSCIEVVMISKNQPDSSMRIFNSIQHHRLPIIRGVFTGGEAPYDYAKAFGTHLYLSTNEEDVINAINEGIAAATVMPSMRVSSQSDTLNIAFDGDAVVFSDESERINRAEGLEAFCKHEKENANKPMNEGPMKSFLHALHVMKDHTVDPDKPVVKVAIVTARSAPAHTRVIHTLRSWGIPIDSFMFLGGLNKAPFLKAFQADIFFDDSRKNVDDASKEVPSAHVPHGIANIDVLNAA